MGKIIKLFISKKAQSNVCGNLALAKDSNMSTSYEKPSVKKLVKNKPTKKVFMGCWQGCNEDADGDGC